MFREDLEILEENTQNLLESIKESDIKEHNTIYLDGAYLYNSKKNVVENKKIDYKDIKSTQYSILQRFDIWVVIASMIFSITFYFLLFTIIISGNKIFIIFLILVYIIGTFIIQNLLLSDNFKFHSKNDFIKDMSKIINSKAYLTFYRTSKIKILDYPGMYIYDITGNLIIPKNINYIKIKSAIFYIDSYYKEFLKMFEEVYGSNYLTLSYLKYNDEIINIKNKVYKINSNANDLASILTTILCLLMLQWIQIVYIQISSNFKCLEISPTKFICKESKEIAGTNIIIEGKKIKSRIFVFVGDIYQNQNCDLNKKYTKALEEKKREIEEKRQRQKEIEDNTFILSIFETKDYFIKIYRKYENVYLNLETFGNYKNAKINKYLGYYNKEIKEEIIKEKGSITYCPCGVNFKIYVIFYEYNYNIQIGEENYKFKYNE